MMSAKHRKVESRLHVGCACGREGFWNERPHDPATTFRFHAATGDFLCPRCSWVVEACRATAAVTFEEAFRKRH